MPLDTQPTSPFGGALVISLDFELHWGVRDHASAHGPYRSILLGAREAVPALLDLFQEYDVAATWAAVGLLFASSREEQLAFAPRIVARYADTRLDPYRESTGRDERDDPLHFAGSLIDRIHRTPRQEVATHTYSHFLCVEQGATADAFREDLDSAVRIAQSKGIALTSIVFPRNQHDPRLDGVLQEHGITCYRGCAASWLYQPAQSSREHLARRALRLLDAHLPITGTQAYPLTSVPDGRGLYNVRAGHLLRPASGAGPHVQMRLSRIIRAMRRAAETRQVFHLWWHPHNFGVRRPEKVAFLRKILDASIPLRKALGFESLTMAEVARRAGPGGERRPT
ncbi:MAG: polysaccharide deacetylase family protein [Polyangiaceae bacterium]|nr:polysaccharide deacetylase family protein [Polyangiaceae bacterium]